MGDLILGEDLLISFCKAGDTISLGDWLASSQVSLSGEEMTECKHLSNVGSCDTTYHRSLITPQYQRDTATNMSQLPSGVMQRKDRLL